MKQDPAEWEDFSPIAYVGELLGNRALLPDLTRSAASLAFVMAASCAETMDDRWLTWRTNTSLAARMRVDERTVSAARSELERAGLFIRLPNDNGAQFQFRSRAGKETTRQIKPGVVIMQLCRRSQESWASSRGFLGGLTATDAKRLRRRRPTPDAEQKALMRQEALDRRAMAEFEERETC